MKKIDWEKVIGYIVIFVLLFIIAFIRYIEENYEITKYLMLLNIILLVTAPLYYFINNYREKRKRKEIENTIIIQNIDFKYYREIIEEYSPAILSFILDGVEVEKDIGASVIYLINKGYLEIQEKNIISRTNKECSKLSEDLQLICNSDINYLLKYEKVYTKNHNEKIQASKSGQTRMKWMKLVEKQAIEKGLLMERNDDKSGITLGVLFILGILEFFIAMATESVRIVYFSSNSDNYTNVSKGYCF